MMAATLQRRSAMPAVSRMRSRSDAILGSTSPPGAIAMFDVAVESKTPQLSLAPVSVPPVNGCGSSACPRPFQ
jgi:hypothetical protein